MRKHNACASEFDYVGWKAWAEWRQDVHAYTPRNDGKKNCNNACAYPSECRWGKKHCVNSTTTKATYEAYSPSSTPSAPTKTDKPRSSLFLDKLIKSAENKSAGLKALLSPVEEEEARPSTSPLRRHYELPDLQFATLTSEPEYGEDSPEDLLMGDSDEGESGSDATGALPNEASALKQPTFSLDTTLTEVDNIQVDRIIAYASAGISFDFTSDNAIDSISFVEQSPTSPTSPGRRNAWDWSIDAPDGMVLADELNGEEQVVGEDGNFFDLEML